ncbi:hypothetical protein TNCV_1162531 [Trichonephila clavipes]|nr:hypothetical protein TNCV_1162531 [Trichonephila clavipes]
MSECMEDTSLRIASFSSDRLDGPDRYTRDFKYPHNQKSADVKSGYRGGHGYLQRLLTILSSPNVCIRNALTGGRPNATIMVVKVTMKREMSFICPQDVKNPGGILLHFREGPLRKCFPLCGICWKKFMVRLQFVWVQLEDSTKNIADR